ncbi:MAG: YkoP family protein [Bacillota bacterium]
MSGATLMQRLGMAIDRRYLKKAGAVPIPGSKLGLLMICYHPYHGKTALKLPEGVLINPEDPIAEFHLSNHRILEISQEQSERSMEWRLLEMLKEEFSALAKACSEKQVPAEIKGFYGVNVLTAGAKRLGFTLVPIPKGWEQRWLGFWETILRKIFYSFKTKKKASFQKTKTPYEVWITREQLIKRY